MVGGRGWRETGGRRKTEGRRWQVRVGERGQAREGVCDAGGRWWVGERWWAGDGV